MPQMKLNIVERSLIHDALRAFVGGASNFNWDQFKNEPIKDQREFQDFCTDLADKIMYAKEICDAPTT